MEQRVLLDRTAGAAATGDHGLRGLTRAWHCERYTARTKSRQLNTQIDEHITITLITIMNTKYR